MEDNQINISIAFSSSSSQFTNPEFQLSKFKVLQSVFIFLIKELYWHFWVHCDINLKLLSGKNTQKVNQQKNRYKNLGFVIGCSMS